MAFNNNYCCVPECKSWAKKDTERQLTFHRFPEANARKVCIENKMGKHLMDHRKAWILKLKICKQVFKSMKVCSLHFNKDDYFHKGLMKQRGRILKKTAVPSQRLPVELGENCRLNKMVVCWAPGCNHYNLRETCSMFRFPKDPETRKRWITLTRWTVVPSADAFLCSCHFVDGNKENGPTLFVYFKEKQLRFPSAERRLQKKTPMQFDDTRRQAAEASSSSTDSPTLSVDPEEVDIKEEDFSDTEEKPAKRLKTEPQDLSDTYDEDSKSTLTVKTEPLDKPSNTMGSGRDPFEPSDLNYYPEVKEEPLDIKEFGEASLINSSEPGTSGVAVKSEADDPGSSNNVNFCEVYLPEETDVRIKQEIELPPDDL